MAVKTASMAATDHLSPCPALDELTKRVEVVELSINDRDSGLGAHTQALKNNVRQMDRIEGAIGEANNAVAAVNARINGLMLLLVTTLATALITLATTLLRMGRL